MTSRSQIMRAVKSQNTSPELSVRRLLHRLGYRYRLHKKDLPGKPDIVLSSRRAVIFVHGCFWHGHTCKRGNRQPKTNTPYWIRKIAGNKARDARNQRLLRAKQWRVLLVWECQLREMEKLEQKIATFLNKTTARRRLVGDGRDSLSEAH